MSDEKKSLMRVIANKYEMEPAAFHATLLATVLPKNINNEQIAAFLIVAHEYNLNPITKEIYALPSQGGIQPIVPIDGWLKIINSNPNFDGMEFDDNLEDGKLVSITCRMYRNDRDKPTSVTEYLSECKRNTTTWKQWPARMLRHKATIQASRYTFGLSGIMELDEVERKDDIIEPQPLDDLILDSSVIDQDKDITDINDMLSDAA
jgi:phage recombination protein Bet